MPRDFPLQTKEEAEAARDMQEDIAAASAAHARGRRDYSEVSFEDNPYQRRSPLWLHWNEGWRAAQLADPLLDDDEKSYGW